MSAFSLFNDIDQSKIDKRRKRQTISAKKRTIEQGRVKVISVPSLQESSYFVQHAEDISSDTSKAKRARNDWDFFDSPADIIDLTKDDNIPTKLNPPALQFDNRSKRQSFLVKGKEMKAFFRLIGK